MKREQRNDKIDAALGQRQAFEVADREGEVAAPGARERRGEARRCAAAGASGEDRRRMWAGRANVDGESELAFDQRQPVGELGGGAGKQEISAGVLARAPPGAVEPRGGECAVEDQRGRGVGHGALIARGGSERKGGPGRPGAPGSARGEFLLTCRHEPLAAMSHLPP